MKFGIIGNIKSVNIGDDIQSFAISNFLPSVDYFIDREHLNSFKSDDGEPVAVVMAAWYMWKKWNWPPSKYIVPKLISMHYADYQVGNQPGGPIKNEFMTGIGKDYMNAHGPVGCRDMFTYENFKGLGIDCYFSGCVTLTLPKMPKVESDCEYICAVDLRPPSLKKLKSILKDSDIELKVISHNKGNVSDDDSDWESVKKDVVELLTLYQNAKCVVTRRLHCALPCLAMEVPVFVINSRSKAASNRFQPYFEWMHTSKEGDFVNDNYDYDFFNPPPNNGKHISTREKLIREIKEFVDKYKDEHGSVDEYVKTTYTSDDILVWQNEAMRVSLDKWVCLFDEIHEQIESLWTSWEEKQRALSDLSDSYDVIFNSKGIRAFVSVRNLAFSKKNKIRLPKRKISKGISSENKKVKAKRADIYPDSLEIRRKMNEEIKTSVEKYRNGEMPWQRDTSNVYELNDKQRNLLDEWSIYYREETVLVHRLENDIEDFPNKLERLNGYSRFTSCRSVTSAIKVVNVFKSSENKLTIPKIEN